jgi:hypothetical protein
MDKVFTEIIQRVPYLLWPIIVVLSLYGLIALSTKIYSLVTKVNQDYKKELQEHLEFKGKRLEEYMNYASELNGQLNTQKEISELNYKIAMDTLNEKSRIQQEYGYALMTCKWMLERERFTRKLLATFISKASLPEDMNMFLNKNIHDIISIIDSNDNLYYKISEESDESYEAKIVSSLSKEYLSIPIGREVKIFTELSQEASELPTLAQAEIPNSDISMDLKQEI